MNGKFKLLDRKYLLCTGFKRIDNQGRPREDCMLYEVHSADTFLKRLSGYMFRRKPHHEAILIKPCSSIHTFFMRFDIDVYFLNENMEVIKKIEALKPWKAVPPVRGAVSVVEIPSVKK